MITRRWIFPALVAGLFVQTAHANTMRCGQHVINTGDHRDTVLEYCGSPSEQISDREWIYDFGPTHLLRVIEFNLNDHVQEITERDRR